MLESMLAAIDSISDLLLVLSLPLAAMFVANYGTLSPWYRSAVGRATFLNGFSNMLLLALIVFGIVFGQSISETPRVIVSSLVILALIYKNGVLIWERARARSRYRADRELPDL